MSNFTKTLKSFWDEVLAPMYFVLFVIAFLIVPPIVGIVVLYGWVISLIFGGQQ